MSKAEREWRIGLHVEMSKSNLENAVLDQRRFYEMKFISRTDNKHRTQKNEKLVF